ncbi:triphosphoribosyl-dephospho-CoA synthase [Anaeromyxobacter diazotrophicus]|uniref:triphosphoribosyl-dephospho-CoA synthase n=1 Tax=Anaeromyxobacter diazotrophicus TaxID=2590199 RepID=A0A7I9VQY7_9BACT|nr:triphosphoribosyl-dephospho-CoA synthase [Anaeromyxobacter diazotrophicus]GEJ58833.1 2-(5''-triphosphoribosyl)-3'-dephosphocoenzyme-A synthase [Anaeromyxobacter diazotrophicus]
MPPLAAAARLDASPVPDRLAALAVRALVEEAELTPKPALVDRRGRGAHHDLDLALMRRSAEALRGAFAAMAEAAAGAPAGLALRERLGALGRAGERAMLAATGGVNTHRGALWALGLLVAAASQEGGAGAPAALGARAAMLARLPDRFAPAAGSHGSLACLRFRVAGARGEARAGFPHAVAVGWPALREARARGAGEEAARLDALLAIMARLDDTCLLHRAGLRGLHAAQRGAAAALAAGGAGTPEGRRALLALDAALLALRASPGGSADLLAAVLFLDALGGEPPPGR